MECSQHTVRSGAVDQHRVCRDVWDMRFVYSQHLVEDVFVLLCCERLRDLIIDDVEHASYGCFVRDPVSSDC